MVEPRSVKSAIPQVVELKNQRRVCRSLTKFTDSKQRSFLLAADMMHGHTNMDGKVKLISLTAILAQQQQATQK